MKLRLLAVVAPAALALAAASSASAASYTINTITGEHVVEPLITDFNSDSEVNGNITDLAAGYQFSQGNTTLDFTRDGVLGLWPGISAPPPADNGEIDITVKGPWLHTILFEVPVLAIVNEVYFRATQSTPDLVEGRSRLQSKMALIRDNPAMAGCKVADYGTRRRFSRSGAMRAAPASSPWASRTWPMASPCHISS